MLPKLGRLVSIITTVSLVFFGSVFSSPAAAATRAVIVLDPDDDVARVDWPTTYGLITELPLNIRLANAVKTRLWDNCRAEVILTRDDPGQAIVPVTARRQAAEAASPDLMVTLAFVTAQRV